MTVNKEPFVEDEHHEFQQSENPNVKTFCTLVSQLIFEKLTDFYLAKIKNQITNTSKNVRKVTPTEPITAKI